MVKMFAFGWNQLPDDEVRINKLAADGWRVTASGSRGDHVASHHEWGILALANDGKHRRYRLVPLSNSSKDGEAVADAAGTCVAIVSGPMWSHGSGGGYVAVAILEEVVN